MSGSIYKNGIFYGEPNSSVKYYDNPQDYYNLSQAEKEAMTELVILNDGDNPLDANLIAYGNGSVADELTKITKGIGARAISGISFYENMQLTNYGQTLPFDLSVENTNTDIFSAPDNSGILIKQRGIYSVRVRVHGVCNTPHSEVCLNLARFRTWDEKHSFFNKFVCGTYARQFTIDASVILKVSDPQDRLELHAWSPDGNNGNYIFGARDAGDTILEVTKIANIE